MLSRFRFDCINFDEFICARSIVLLELNGYWISLHLFEFDWLHIGCAVFRSTLQAMSLLYSEESTYLYSIAIHLAHVSSFAWKVVQIRYFFDSAQNSSI